MSDKDKLERMKKLADAMYYAAQNLTTDASRLHKAMKEYHQFIITEYHKQEPASEDLKKASKKWLTPQLDKSYADYGERKMMELTHFDGYAMLDAVEFGAQWQKTQDQQTVELAEEHAMLAGMMQEREQMMKDAIEGEVKTLYRHIVYVESVGFDSSSLRENKQGVFVGDKVKVIIIKE